MTTKKVLALTALAALAACSKPADGPANEVTTPAESSIPSSSPLAADGKSSVGTFKITTSDGKVYTEVVKADGTYESTGPDKKVTAGTWEQINPNLYCNAETGKEMRCNEEKVEDGTWTSKDQDGKIAKVERVG